MILFFIFKKEEEELKRVILDPLTCIWLGWWKIIEHLVVDGPYWALVQLLNCSKWFQWFCCESVIGEASTIAFLFIIKQLCCFPLGTSGLLIGWITWRFKSCQEQALHWSKGCKWSCWWGSCKWVLGKSQGSKWFCDRGCLPGEYNFEKHYTWLAGCMKIVIWGVFIWLI